VLAGPGSLGQFGWVEPGRAWCWAARVGLGLGLDRVGSGQVGWLGSGRLGLGCVGLG